MTHDNLNHHRDDHHNDRHDESRDQSLTALLTSLLLDPSVIDTTTDLFFGEAALHDGEKVHVFGIAHRAVIGVDEAARLAADILSVAGRDDGTPILCVIDSSSQRMSRRDELLGLYEYLAHLAKCLLLAERNGHPTIAVMYGGSAAGAFIATALAASRLFAVPGAHPEVMDLPSMARVTKLSLDMLTRQAETTPVFAPGVENFFKTGGIAEMWDPSQSLAQAFLDAVDASSLATGKDMRSALGWERGGRPKAADIADQVRQQARRHG